MSGFLTWIVCVAIALLMSTDLPCIADWLYKAQLHEASLPSQADH